MGRHDRRAERPHRGAALAAPASGNTISSATVIGPYVYVADRGASISSTHGDLFAYRVGDGHAVWRFPDGRFSTVIAAAGLLIVAGTLHLYALEPRPP